MHTYTPDELKAILELHAKYLRGEEGGKRADLSYANLSRADLSGANLSGANLYGAFLSYANLSDADLSGANLARANLARAKLSGASFTRADLSDANLARANLARAKLSDASLTGAKLTRASLTGADLTRASLSDADLTGADLGVKTKYARSLRLLGACMDGAEWLEAKEKTGADPEILLKEAPPAFYHWLKDTVGGDGLTVARVDHVLAFVTRGCKGL